MGRFDDIPEIALGWIRSGQKVALATVIQTWGSAPRPVGAQLAIRENGDFQGSVSGGCVEGAVVVEAQASLIDGQARILEYGVADDTAFAVGLACGGTIRIMVEPVGEKQGPEVAELKQLVAARAARQPIARLINTRSWQRRLSGGDADPLSGAIKTRFRSDKSGFQGDWFVDIHNPPLRLFVVGAVHIAQALLPMARGTGYDVVLIDPRGAFASETRFPQTDIHLDWPDDILAAAGLDQRAAVVTLSHDPKIDDPAILETLKSDAFYLGCLGSPKTHAKRLSRLKEAGVGTAQLARINAPVGLDIGAKSPAEIAVSILAEITACLRKGDPVAQLRA